MAEGKKSPEDDSPMGLVIWSMSSCMWFCCCCLLPCAILMFVMAAAGSAGAQVGK